MPNWMPGEEIANAITHGVGATLAITATVFLIIKAIKVKNFAVLFSNIVFGISLIIMYSNSTLYHSIVSEPIKKIFRYGDHISIYLLIAGSYTPFTMTILKGATGIILTIIEWTIAVTGITLKILFFDGFETASLIIYIAMGWMIVFFIGKLLKNLDKRGILWLIAGGLSYTGGCYFYKNDHKIYFGHAIWHLFVLFGSFCHFMCVYFYTSNQHLKTE